MRPRKQVKELSNRDEGDAGDIEVIAIRTPKASRPARFAGRMTEGHARSERGRAGKHASMRSGSTPLRTVAWMPGRGGIHRLLSPSSPSSLFPFLFLPNTLFRVKP
jgi:hypothetical protein